MTLKQNEAFEKINQLAREMGFPNIFGVAPRRTRNAYLYWEPPKGWEKNTYIFAYTPWRTKDPDTGREGFFALKYRRLKNGSLKLVKATRFGRRKIADKRAQLWYSKYYGEKV